MNRRGRVAVVATFPPHVIPGFEHLRPEGHYATWLPQLAHSFSKASEYDIHWIVCHRQTQSLKPALWMGQTFHFLAIPSRFSTLSGFWIDTLRIKTILDRIRPDLVHGWGSEGPSGYAAIRSHRKSILSVQGILSEYVASARMPLVLRARAFLERQMLRKSQWITVESSWGEEVIRKIAPQASISRIEYGVNPVFYDVVWAPQPEHPIAAFIGTTDHRKGIEAVVSAFCDSRLAKAELWVFGDDNSPLATKLRRISPANVKWLGRKPAGELARHLQKTWCLVLPTRADTSPNAVKECRVIGLPVITTRSGGQRDYIQDGRNGFLVEPDDASLLTERLHQVLGNLELATSLGAFDHQKQRAFFHPENTGQSFRKLYAQLLCGSGKPFEQPTLKL